MFAFTIIPVALTAGALAIPAALSARQDPCNALGVGSTSSVSYNFKLEVVDPSAADSTTGPVLALVESDLNDGLWFLKEIHQNSTGEFAAWTLNKGALIPTPSSINSGLVGSDMAVSAGSVIEFAVTNNSSANAAAGQTPYCAVSDAGGHATLAVNADGNSFSVCQTPDLAWVLVYSASSDNDAYIYDSCTKQNVHLAQV